MNAGRPRHMLRTQIAIVFLFAMICASLSTFAVNGLFLEKYYISKKSDTLLETKEYLESLVWKEASEDQSYEKILEHYLDDSTDYTDPVRKRGSKSNLSWVVISNDNQLLGHLGDNYYILRDRLFGYVYDLYDAREHGRVLKETENYILQQSHDRFLEGDFIELWGILQSDKFFLIRTPLESIRESASISNRFYILVGVAVSLLSCLCLWLYTKRLTRPISELTDLSRQMSNLEFEAKYHSHSGNEIDVLGENFNRMSSELEKTISELKSANHELEKDIQDKIKIDEMRKEFLDSVSHELKTPIALIQGYAEGLRENITDDPESMDFYCEVIMDEAQKMNKLVKNLLLLNQLESGKDTAFMERFNIVSLIEGVLGKMEILIRQKEAKVIFQPEQDVYVWADEFKTEEVVTNYLSNALHHLDGDGIIEIRLIREGERVRISVFNTGSPIPEEALPNLWNKFYKVDKARTREYGGSGIGLSIVKAILDGMNQEYTVKNYDNGVEFTFTLACK